MEFLKAIIKSATEQKTVHVELCKGLQPILIINKKPTPLTWMAPVSEDTWEQLVDFAFPTEKTKILTNQLTRGEFPMPPVGQVKVLFQPEDPPTKENPSIHLFFTSKGYALMEELFIKLRHVDSEFSGFVPTLPAMPIPTLGESGVMKTAELATTLDDPDEVNLSPNEVVEEDISPPPTQETGTQVRIKPTFRQNVELTFGALLPGEKQHNGSALDQLLKLMEDHKASDIHLTVGKAPFLRINGEIVPTSELPISASKMSEYFKVLISDRIKQELSESLCSRFSYEIKGRGRFRISLFRDLNGIGAAIRRIPAQIPSPKDLGLPASILNFCTLNKGLVLFGGEANTGKTTSLVSLLDNINKTSKAHILTIEDPTEFTLNPDKCMITQKEIGRQATSFEQAISSALQEDYDVIMIGKINDLETIDAIFSAVEAGILVFVEINALSIFQMIDKIINFYPPENHIVIRKRLAHCLKGAVIQTLVNRKANQSLIPAHEIFIVTEIAAPHILDNRPEILNSYLQSQKQDGNQTMNEYLIALLTNNIIDINEALKKTNSKFDLLDQLKKRKIEVNAPGPQKVA